MLFMEQLAYTNHWKHHHNSLPPEKTKQCKARIGYVLGISQSAFYRKLANPQRFLTIAEKNGYFPFVRFNRNLFVSRVGGVERVDWLMVLGIQLITIGLFYRYAPGLWANMVMQTDCPI
jgi:hypothetical protein